MSNKIYSVILLLFIASTPITVRAQTIKIGIFNFEPWGMKSRNAITGIVWQQSLALFKETKLTLSANYSSYPRMIHQLKTGKVDCSLFIKNDENADKLNFISHLYDLKVSVISRKDIQIKQYSDFYTNPKLDVIGFASGTGFMFPRLFNDLRLNLHIAPNQQQGPMMIVRERIDAFVGITKTMQYEIHRGKLADKLNFPGYPVTQLPVWLQCSKKSAISDNDLLILKTSAEKLKLDGTLDAIIGQWIPASL